MRLELLVYQILMEKRNKPCNDVSSLCSQVFATLGNFIFTFEGFSCFPHYLSLLVSITYSTSMHQTNCFPAYLTALGGANSVGLGRT